ncbi:hypothetical protein TNCV_2260901 [Trichonephila clavipes]|nr:hypothetical protein TNCV_2260901 [Trichonephila clavipes]
MGYPVLIWRYRKNLELLKVSYLGLSNDSKITEIPVDVTINIIPRVTTPNADRCLAVTQKRSRWNSASDPFCQLSAATGTAIRGSVVVVHEEPHPQMTGTLSYRPEATGGRQREKSLDTRHWRLDDRYRVLPWPEDCMVVVCLHDALYGVYL